MLGWFVISISPKSDRLVKNLEKADENILEGIEPVDQDTALRSSGVWRSYTDNHAINKLLEGSHVNTWYNFIRHYCAIDNINDFPGIISK